MFFSSSFQSLNRCTLYTSILLLVIKKEREKKKKLYFKFSVCVCMSVHNVCVCKCVCSFIYWNSKKVGEREKVTWCFTPSKPGWLYQGNHYIYIPRTVTVNHNTWQTGLGQCFTSKYLQVYNGIHTNPPTTQGACQQDNGSTSRQKHGQ